MTTAREVNICAFYSHEVNIEIIKSKINPDTFVPMNSVCTCYTWYKTVVDCVCVCAYVCVCLQEEIEVQSYVHPSKQAVSC